MNLLAAIKTMTKIKTTTTILVMMMMMRTMDEKIVELEIVRRSHLFVALLALSFSVSVALFIRVRWLSPILFSSSVALAAFVLPFAIPIE